MGSTIQPQKQAEIYTFALDIAKPDLFVIAANWTLVRSVPPSVWKVGCGPQEA